MFERQRRPGGRDLLISAVPFVACADDYIQFLRSLGMMWIDAKSPTFARQEEGDFTQKQEEDCGQDLL